MLNAIYKLEGILIQSLNNHANLIEINEIFMDADILTARKNAFRKFQSYIEVLLDSIGARFVSDQQAQSDLVDFINSKQQSFISTRFGVDVDEDFEKGLYLYFIPDSDNYIITKEGEKVYAEKYLVRYIDNGNSELYKIVERNRKNERIYLIQNQINTKYNDWELDEILGQLSDG